MKLIGYYRNGDQDCITNAAIENGQLVNRTEYTQQMVPLAIVLNTFRHLYERDMKTAEAAAEAGHKAKDTTKTVEQSIIEEIRFQMNDDKVNIVNDDLVLSKEGDQALEEIINCKDKKMMKILLLDLIDGVANGCAQGFTTVLTDMRNSISKSA